MRIPKQIAGEAFMPAAAFGWAPNPHGTPETWSYDRGAARHLKLLCGRELPWFNLYDVEPELYDRREARHIARAWCQQNHERRWTLLLLGRRVCDAFGIKDPEWLEWYRSPLWGPMIAVPHPSGLNRWYNSPTNASEARRVLTLVAYGKLPRVEHNKSPEEDK